MYVGLGRMRSLSRGYVTERLLMEASFGIDG